MKEALTSSRTVLGVTLPTIEIGMERTTETRVAMDTKYSAFVFV